MQSLGEIQKVEKYTKKNEIEFIRNIGNHSKRGLELNSKVNELIIKNPTAAKFAQKELLDYKHRLILGYEEAIKHRKGYPKDLITLITNEKNLVIKKLNLLKCK